MTSDINLMGELSTTGTVFFVTPSNSTCKIASIRFNNPAAYVLTVKKHNTFTGTATTIYTLNLSAGDTVTDTFPYSLDAGEYLSATSDIIGTSYLLIGTFYPTA